jgi:hypothetical protein
VTAIVTRAVPIRHPLVTGGGRRSTRQAIRKEEPDMRSSRSLSALVLAMLLGLVISAPTAAAREFGTIYVDDVAYRTFANPARVDPGTGTDAIVSFTNFDQGGVAQFAPGRGSHGGRWAVWLATWTDPADAYLVTDFDEVLALARDGKLELLRAEEADFRCPLLPAGRSN